MKKKNITKPTNKDILAEINYLGQRLMSIASVVTNLSKVFDLYILFRKQNKKFEKFLKAEVTKAQKELEKKDK